MLKYWDTVEHHSITRSLPLVVGYPFLRQSLAPCIRKPSILSISSIVLDMNSSVNKLTRCEQRIEQERKTNSGRPIPQTSRLPASSLTW
mmetsp:Transcript_3115/g.10495  ORF Transcript_3115/g.10495 Transcript_3115/m.10495 type:complete len:89 (-) Transcript_3115:16-282(-)